jgi:hypothetical protein
MRQIQNTTPNPMDCPSGFLFAICKRSARFEEPVIGELQAD